MGCRNHGSSSWTQMEEFQPLSTIPATISQFLKLPQSCSTLLSTMTKTIRSGSMPTKSQTLTAKCSSGYFLQWVWGPILVHIVWRDITNFQARWCRSHARPRYIYTFHWNYASTLMNCICAAGHFRNAAKEDIPYAKTRKHMVALILQQFSDTQINRLPRRNQAPLQCARNPSQRSRLACRCWQRKIQSRWYQNIPLVWIHSLAGEYRYTDLQLCRVRVHKFAGIEELDEWPVVKVSVVYNRGSKHVWQSARLG